MDYSKIDAKLSEVMEENLANPGLAIVVFVRLVDSLTPEQTEDCNAWIKELNQKVFGTANINAVHPEVLNNAVLAVTLLAHTIEELSDKSWVRSLKLSGAKKPLNDQQARLNQLFENNSDCYADTLDDSVVLAMSADKFVEVVTKLLAESK